MTAEQLAKVIEDARELLYYDKVHAAEQVLDEAYTQYILENEIYDE